MSDERQLNTMHAPSDQERGAGARRITPARAVLALAAALVILFCAWSMSQYVQGNDPLALLAGTGALNTTEEAAAGNSATDGSAGRPATVSVSGEDVVRAIGSLSFDGQDVSLPSDQVRVVLNADGIWVEQVSTDDASAMVDLTARRAAALATWSRGTGVEIFQVTWISEDANGTVRMCISVQTAAAMASGATSELLSSAAGYQISEDAYASLESDGDFARTSGAPPTLPSGGLIPVSAEKTSTGEVLAEGSVGPQAVLSSSGTSRKSEPGATSSGSPDAISQISVTVTVDGTAAGANASTATVVLPAGSTAYDALLATGVGVNARDTVYGVYVAGINGLAEREHGGSSGWTYAVNGVEPNTSCANYVMSSGDSLVWTYVNVVG